MRSLFLFLFLTSTAQAGNLSGGGGYDGVSVIGGGVNGGVGYCAISWWQ